MAPTRRKPPVQLDQIVVAINTGCTQLDDGTIAFFIDGQRFRESDPVVRQNPAFFVVEGSTAEIAAAKRELHATHYALPAPPAQEIVRRTIEKRLRDEDAVVPKYDLVGIPAGTKLPKKGERVKANPDAFVDVVPAGLKRENAYRALTTMRHRDGQDVEHVVYAGQWVAKEDPMVALHPLNFGLIEA